MNSHFHFLIVGELSAAPYIKDALRLAAIIREPIDHMEIVYMGID